MTSCETCVYFRQRAGLRKNMGRCEVELPPYLQDMLTVQAAKREVATFSNCSFHKEADQ